MLLAERLHAQHLFPGDSEMARLMRALDWSQTALGAPASWTAHLRSALSLCLTSRIPIVMFWGAGYHVLYNDAYISFLGPSKHPRYLGQPARECWREIWATIGPMLDSVVETGQATWSEDVRMYFARRLPLEEVYVRFSFGPILAPDGKSVDGIFCPCTETTERVLAERQLETLRRLGARAPEARTQASVCRDVCRVLEENPADVPFALLYLAEGEQAVLADGCGLADAVRHMPAAVALDPSALKDALPLELRGAPPIGQTLVLPIPGPAHDRLGGLLLAGTSKERVLDDSYRNFFEMVARHIGSALADAAAYEAERERVRALAELDRAKTVFFTNVSHEFRTPLTLMLGPLEDMLGTADEAPANGQRQALASVHRNAERLLRLVNTLLDFARIEGGRDEAAFEPTDLAALTAGLAGTFDSACERAGLRLGIECEPLAQPVFVDREMWEKVVLNLLSNAFKFTLKGEITVRLTTRDGQAELTVADSGNGIVAEELPKLFNRFQRIAGAPGRSIEGSGIGLALSSELVKLHGGTIGAASQPGSGSVFTVRVPFGSAHLPAGQVRPTARKAAPCSEQARPFVVEALQWLPQTPPDRSQDSGFAALAMEAPRELNATAPRVLVADDSADLREYLGRLLGLRYRIALVPDGAAALESARREPPDLIVADVMMPRLDGFELLHELRADRRTKALPVILLSARAGEEARVEGLAAGADDYLSKPFSSRELLARVAAHLAAARIRREADAALRESEELLRAALVAAGAGSWSFDPATEQARWSPETYALLGIDPSVPASTAAGMPHFHPDDAAGLLARRNQQLADDGRIDLEYRLLHPSDGLRWHQARGRRTEDGRVLGITLDITERKLAEQQAREGDETLRIALDAGHAGAWVWRPETGELNYSPEARRLFGIEASLPEARLLRASLERVHPEDLQPMLDANRAHFEASGAFEVQYRIRHPATGLRWLHHRGRRQQGGSVVGIVIDITEQKLAEQAVRDNELRLSLAQRAARLGSWEIDPALGTIECTATHKALYGLEPDAPVSVELLYRMIHEDDREPVRRSVQKSVDERSEFQLEYRVVWPDGGVHWLAGRGRALYDAEGRPVKRLGMTFDITERKAAEAELRARDLQLESITEHTTGLLTRCSRDLRYLFVNRACAEFLGKSRDQIQGRPILEVVGRDAFETVRPYIERVLRGEVVAFETTIPYPRAGLRFVQGTYVPDRDVAGDVVGWFGTITDLTDRKQAEIALRDERERLRAVVEQSLAGVAQLDLNGRFVHANSSFCALVGRKLDELLALRMIDITHPEDRPRNIELLRQLMSGGVPSFVFEKRYLRPDGAVVWVSNHVNLVREEDGRPKQVVVIVLDVSERRAGEQAAVEQAERLRIALKTAQLGSFQLELASGEMESSVQCKANFGLGPEEPLPYARLFELIHAEDRERVQATVRRAIETRTDYEAEYRTIWPRDGSVHWILARGRARYADDGVALRMVGVTQDITERKHYEAALRESESRLRETLDAMPQIVFTAAADGAVTSFNRYAQLYTGHTEASLLGGAWAQSVHPEDLAATSPGWRRAMQSGEPYETECRFRQADGAYRWLLSRVLPIRGRDGNIVRWVGTSTDIDERVRAQGELLATRNQLAAQVADLTLLHEQTTQFTAGRQMKSVLDEVMQGALALTGATKGMLSVVDPSRDDLELVASAGFSPHYLSLVQRVPKGAGACGTCYLRGERVIVEDSDIDPIFEPYREAARIGGYRSAHSTPLAARDGSVLGVLTLFAPRPGRPAEREMRLTDLLTQHAAGYIENLRLVGELEQADRRKDEFLATLAHELRNPLAPIRNSLHLLRMSGTRVSADRLHEMLDRQVNHMVRLVDDLMEVSRISRGKIDLQREPLDLASVVRTAVETSKPLIERGKHELAVLLPDEPLPVDGDAVRLAQLFANLLNNAAKYTDEGGRIELVARRDGESALVSVRDSGIGIAAEQMPRLFEMFAQIDRGSRAQGGLGIGLSLAQRLAQMHGGSIEAASEGLGCGARFTVRLPLAQHTPQGGSTGTSQAATLLPQRLLVVDDNRDAADSLGMVLGFLGGEVRVEHDGASALAAIESWRPQVVLLDLGMPGMDGLEVARRVRAEPRHAGLILVALTGWGQEQDRERTHAAGFDHHLVKPVDISVLQALLASLAGAERK